MSLGQLEGPARTRTVHEYVLKSLRGAIIDGRLVAGTHLVQTDLAQQLDVSITPVREALRDLATEGLVEFDPHRGALVRTLNLDEVREVYELRITLEPLMVRRAVGQITPEQLDRADALRHQMEETKSLSAWAELNRRFHNTLAESDRGSRLSNILNGLRDTSSSYVGISLSASPERIAEANEEHGRLVEYFRAGDVEAAVALAVQHLRATINTIEQTHGGQI